jgi:hypothetical protein
MWGNSRKSFHERLVGGLIDATQVINPIHLTSGLGRLWSQAVRVSWLDFKHSHHCPTTGRSRGCYVPMRVMLQDRFVSVMSVTYVSLIIHISNCRKHCCITQNFFSRSSCIFCLVHFYLPGLENRHYGRWGSAVLTTLHSYILKSWH